MSESQNQSDEAVSGFGDYDTGIVQLSDTELEGVPHEELLDRYGEEDIDAFVYAGDASKKEGQEIGQVSEEDYFEQLEETYDDLDRLGEELGTDIYTLPGNHAPIKGIHNGDKFDDYVENIESMVEDEYEGFSDFEGNAYEFFTEEKDNLVNLENSSFEVGDYTLVGGSHHFGPEVNPELLEQDIGLDELGYDREEIADELSTEGESYDGFLSDVPIVGTFLDYIFGTDPVEVDPEGLSLEDLPDDWDRTEQHEQYEQAMEEYDEKYGSIEELIEEAENDILLFHHGIPASQNQHGSVAMDNILEEYHEDIAMVGGGHTGSPGEFEMYDTPGFNTNGGAYAEIGLQDGDLAYSEVYGVSEPEQGSQPDQMDEQELQQRRVMEMAQVGGPEQFWERREDAFENVLEQQGVPEEQWDTIKQQEKESLHNLWERKDEIIDIPEQPQNPGDTEQTVEAGA